MLDKYSDSQKLFYEYFNRINKDGHVSHSYLIECNGVSYSFNLALDLAKFFLCNGIYDEKICNLIDSNNYSNLKVIGSSSSIKKDEIMSLKTDFSMKSTDDKRQVYIIRDVQNMNKNSANSLLKFLEEPEGNVIAILLCDSAMNVIPTIVSRCQLVTLINDNKYLESIFISLYDEESSARYEDFVSEYVNKFLSIYEQFEIRVVSILSDSSIYELKDSFYEFLCFGYYLYYETLNLLLSRNSKVFFNFDIKKITEKNNTRDIIRKMEVINEFIHNYKYNVNINLFIDNFFISMGSD